MLKKIFERILNPDGSISVDDPNIVDSFTGNPDFPYLVSFPRTGSHWLRMIMELYFEKPALVRIFYFREANDFTCYHTHDMDLALERKSVIYLYRDPVETLYSQLRYYKENVDDLECRQRWCGLYARHLAKWLMRENFTVRKTVITYESMTSDIHSEFSRVCAHFGQSLDKSKLDAALNRVSKKELKQKTTHDRQVVNLSDEYRTARSDFGKKYTKEIHDCILSAEPKLESFLP
jgi:hypothetical protein